MRKKLTQEAQLKAWETWKTVCSISGCRPDSPAIMELISDKQDTPENYLEYYGYLKRQVCKWFCDAVGQKCGLFRNNPEQLKHFIIEDEFNIHRSQRSNNTDASDDSNTNSSQETDDDWGDENDGKDFLQNDGEIYSSQEENAWKEMRLIPELDSMISEYRPKGKKDVSLKAYKDWIWNKTHNSDDPAIKIIAGYVKGLLLTLAAHKLSRCAHIREAKNGKGWEVVNSISWDAPTDDEDQDLTIGSCIPYLEFDPFADSSPAPQERSELQKLAEEALKIFDVHANSSQAVPANGEKIVLLAYLTGINITDPLVQKCLNRGRDTCSRIKGLVVRKMESHREMFSELIAARIGGNVLKKALISVLRSEKNAKPLLSYIEKHQLNDTKE